MASEPENPTVVVGGWIGASRTQSAATATAGDATVYFWTTLCVSADDEKQTCIGFRFATKRSTQKQ